MAVIETWFKQDLQKAVQVKHFEGSLFSGNANGNRIGVIVTNNGSAVSLSGTVSGYAVLADGTSVPCTGSLSGNRASVLLPAAAYKPGIVFISIFLTSGSTVTTLAAVAANVQQARTDSQVSPGSAVTDWTQTINAAMQSVVDANAANMAVEYGSLTYPVPVGTYTIYNDLLYRCIVPIATAESWTASHWVRVRIADDVADLKSALKQSDNELFRVSGYLNQNYIVGRERYVNNGAEAWANAAKWISPAAGEYIEFKSGDRIITHQNQYGLRVCYSTDNKVTWMMSSEIHKTFTMPADAVGWISVVKTTTAEEADIDAIIDGHVIEIQRDGINFTERTNTISNGIVDAININPNAGFNIASINKNVLFAYTNTTAAIVGTTEKLFDIPCTQGETFRISFDFKALRHSDKFSDFELMVREIGDNESSPLRSVGYRLSQSSVVDFTVYYSDTKKIIANVNLVRSSEAVSSGFDEMVSYTITVIKVGEVVDSEARNQISVIDNELEELTKLDLTLYDGYYNAFGVVVADTSEDACKYTQKIKCFDGMKIFGSLSYLTAPHAMWIATCEWKKDGTFTRTNVISRNLSEYEFTYAPSADIEYVSITFRSFNDYNFILKAVTGIYALYKVVSDSTSGKQPPIVYAFSNHLIKGINHRGYNRTAPENTMPAFKLSVENGFSFVETDIRFTSDNVPVLLHDATVDRTSNGTGNIADMTFAQARQLDFGAWKSETYAGTKIPSFEEFICFCRDTQIFPYIEISATYTAAQYDILCGIVDKYNMTNAVTWISFTANNLKAITSRNPSARICRLHGGAMTEQIATQADELKTGVNEVFISVDYNYINADTVTICANHDLPLETWTINTAELIANLPDYVSGGTSDVVNFETIKRTMAME